MKMKFARSVHILLLVVTLSGIPAIIYSQATSTGEMPQYLLPEFRKCEVLMKTGARNSALMNYNIVTEKMVFIANDKFYDMTNPDAADTVNLDGRKFVPVGKAFYEVLVSGPVTAFIQHKGSLMSAGKPVGYGGTSQTASANYISNIELSGIQYNIALPSDYVVNNKDVYWIRTGEKWLDFTTEKQFLAIYPDKAAQIKSFIKTNKIKIDRPDDLKKLVKYCAGQ
jgi:hypothetical protein